MEQISLKEYAKQARKRLMNGYWEGVRDDRQRFLEAHYHRGDNLSQLKKMFRKKVENELFGSDNENNADDELYKKVAKLLTENEYVLNPIMQLIDHDEYDKLDEHAKQNYIFELTDKYNELKTRFEKEQKNSLVVNS